IVGQILLLTQARQELFAHAEVEVEFLGRAREHFRARVEAEQAREGVVAIEDSAIAGGAEPAGQIALPTLAVAQLGAAQRFFELLAFGEIQGDAAEEDASLGIAKRELDG